MSEEICQVCGNLKSSCTCGAKANQVIEIRHTGLPKDLKGSKGSEEEELRGKLEMREEQLKVIALKQLEDEVTKFASVIQDEGKRKAVINNIMNSDDPLSNFERKKEMLSLFKMALGQGDIGITGDDNPDDIEQRPPSGDGRGVPQRRVLEACIVIHLYDRNARKEVWGCHNPFLKSLRTIQYSLFFNPSKGLVLLCFWNNSEFGFGFVFFESPKIDPYIEVFYS